MLAVLVAAPGAAERRLSPHRPSPASYRWAFRSAGHLISSISFCQDVTIVVKAAVRRGEPIYHALAQKIKRRIAACMLVVQIGVRAYDTHQQHTPPQRGEKFQAVHPAVLLQQARRQSSAVVPEATPSSC